MNICFFLGGFYQNGGIGRVTSILANSLENESNYNVIALKYFDPGKPNIYQLSSGVKEFFFLEQYRSMTHVLLHNGVKQLRTFLLDNKVDVLIACGALFFPISVKACKGIETKCICWEHSNPEGNSDHKVQLVSRLYGIKRADLNVVLTNSALRVYKDKYGVDNTIQIYNPIDPVILNDNSIYHPENKKIISVGRLTYQKNFETAVMIAGKILNDHPDWEWDVYGKGEEYDSLIELTKKLNVDKQMHFMGQVSDLYDRYSQYSFMVMTSRYEGFPMTLLEGLGKGLPLVSFDIQTGPNEIIMNEVNGFLIDAFDVDDMSKCIDRLITDSSLLVTMNNNNKELCKKYSLEEITRKWLKALNMLKE